MEKTCNGCIYHNTLNDDLCGTCGDDYSNKDTKGNEMYCTYCGKKSCSCEYDGIETLENDSWGGGFADNH